MSRRLEKENKYGTESKHFDRVTFNSNINIRDININIRVSPLYVNSKQIRKWIKIKLLYLEVGEGVYIRKRIKSISHRCDSIKILVITIIWKRFPNVKYYFKKFVIRFISLFNARLFKIIYDYFTKILFQKYPRS